MNTLNQLMIFAVIYNRIARQWVLNDRFMKSLSLTTGKVKNVLKSEKISV